MLASEHCNIVGILKNLNIGEKKKTIPTFLWKRKIPGDFKPSNGKSWQVADDENCDNSSANSSKAKVFCASEIQHNEYNFE